MTEGLVGLPCTSLVINPPFTSSVSVHTLPHGSGRGFLVLQQLPGGCVLLRHRLSLPAVSCYKKTGRRSWNLEYSAHQGHRIDGSRALANHVAIKSTQYVRAPVLTANYAGHLGA